MSILSRLAKLGKPKSEMTMDDLANLPRGEFIKYYNEEYPSQRRDLLATEQGYGQPTFHYTRANKEFDQFKDRIPKEYNLWDYIGEHSGTRKAAEDRFNAVKPYFAFPAWDATKTDKPVEWNDPERDYSLGHTLPLRIKNKQPLLHPKTGEVMTETQIENFLDKFANDLGVDTSSDVTKADFKDIYRTFWDQYDHIPYLNAVEDAGSISYISPAENMRSEFAEFEPGFKHQRTLKGSADPKLLAGIAGGSLAATTPKFQEGKEKTSDMLDAIATMTLNIPAETGAAVAQLAGMAFEGLSGDEAESIGNRIRDEYGYKPTRTKTLESIAESYPIQKLSEADEFLRNLPESKKGKVAFGSILDLL